MSIRELAGVLRSADKNGNKHVLYPMTKIDLVDGLRDYLESLEVSKTITGSSLAVDDSANLPLLGLSLYGKSTQKRTTGAQLVNLPNIEAYDVKGITWSCENGVVTAKGTSTAISSSSDKIVADIPVIAGTYYVSGGVGEVKVYVRIVQADGSYVWYTDQAFMLDGTEDQVTLYCQVVAGMTVDATLYPMLNAGDAPLTWELYTGGIPSPNPNFPQEIVSIGSAGSIDVNVHDGSGSNETTQTLSISTPNGLPGIQVTDASLANYTDPYGNMWCCDEVDFGRGVYVKRVYHKVFDGTESYALADTDGSRGYHFALNDLSMKYSIQGSLMGALCNKLCEVNTDVLYGNIREGFAIGYKSARFRLRFTSLPDITTVEALKSKLAEWYANGEPLELMTLLDTPIETPLSESELAQYAALHTNCPNTTVLNDKSAEMSLTYYTKRYNEAIDFIINKIENNKDEIRAIKDIVEVTLLASNWSGSTAPYTQTVYVPGITEDHNPLLVSTLYDGASVDAQKAYIKAFGIIASGVATVNNGSVTFKVYKLPAVDITVGLKGV